MFLSFLHIFFKQNTPLNLNFSKYLSLIVKHFQNLLICVSDCTLHKPFVYVWRQVELQLPQTNLELYSMSAKRTCMWWARQTWTCWNWNRQIWCRKQFLDLEENNVTKSEGRAGRAKTKSLNLKREENIMKMEDWK